MKKWMQKSIVNKLGILIISFTIILFLLYALLSTTLMSNYSKDKSREQLIKDSKQISSEINSFINENIKIIDTMSTNPDFLIIMEEIDDRFKKQEHPLYDKVNAQLKEIKEMNENISLIYLGLNESNAIISNLYDDFAPMDYDINDRYWYQKSLMSENAVVSPPYIDARTGESAVTISKMVFKDDKLLGAIAIDLMIDDIHNIMDEYRVGNSGYTILVHQNQEVLYHPKENISIGKTLPEDYGFYAFESFMKDEDLKEGFIYDNNNKYISFYPVENTNWVTLAIIDKDEVYSSVNQLMYVNFFILIVFILFIIFILKRITYFITSPIVKISNEIKAFGNEETNIDLPSEFYNRKDEIGFLSNGLKHTIDRLNEYLYEIRNTNKSLSKEIENRKSIQLKLEMILKLLSKTNEGIFILDSNYNCIYNNNALEEMLKYNNLEYINFKEENILINDDILEQIHLNKHWNDEIRIKLDTLKIFLFKLSYINYENQIFYIGSLTDLTLYKENEKEAYYLKYFDPLTKLHNKKYLEENINKLFEEENSNNKKHSLIIINIDKFRLINEAKGYEFGNSVLIKTSNQLKEFIEKDDFLIRISNDEFGILKLNIKDNQYIYDYIMNLSNEINKSYIIDNDQIFINFSMGISIYPNDATDYEQLYNNASSALNNAKLDSLSNYKFYDEYMNNISIKKYELQNKLRSALENEEFFLVYQPQINMSNKEIIGIEALIRWKSGSEIIPPNIFIPIVEESNLIIPIGEWVLKEACKTAYNLYLQGFKFKVGVNVSRLQFKKDYIIPLVSSVLKNTELPAHLLELEITESILMDNEKEGEYILNELKALNVKISIDDFGTGYSSLSYLKKFAVNKIKIDRSFVKDIPKKDNGIIAKVIIELADNLGLDVIAEGVETKAQEEFLLNNKCEKAQGFLYSKPLEKEELIKFIKKAI